eukprot:CAMPEP_0176412138 /NCGR_PEP_ID=MMETSP0127-20121128/3981_1 /TAXON_ID=938130 /ORGANISM="Platyophrya macrostoma, Strain WH" /LENGTH=115 /DNA_ID=CAMNT_0017791783 /DNA_START=33 /DNA_END=377 /DNA_ORIENTATION=-
MADESVGELTSMFSQLIVSGLIEPKDLVENGFLESATTIMLGECPERQRQSRSLKRRSEKPARLREDDAPSDQKREANSLASSSCDVEKVSATKFTSVDVTFIRQLGTTIAQSSV